MLIALYRKMSPEKKTRQVEELTQGVQLLALSRLREADPEAPLRPQEQAIDRAPTAVSAVLRADEPPVLKRHPPPVTRPPPPCRRAPCP